MYVPTYKNLKKKYISFSRYLVMHMEFTYEQTIWSLYRISLPRWLSELWSRFDHFCHFRSGCQIYFDSSEKMVQENNLWQRQSCFA